MTVNVQYIDTCTSDYLTDHCNGDNEALFGVPVHAGDTVYSVMVGLEAEALQIDTIPTGISDQTIKRAIHRLFHGAPCRLDAAWSEYLPDVDDEHAETSFAWFRFSWSAIA